MALKAGASACLAAACVFPAAALGQFSLTTQVPPSSGLAGPEGSIFLYLQAFTTVRITAFDYFAGFPGSVTVDIFSRPGMYAAHIGSPGEWQHVVTINTTAASFTTPVRLDLPAPVLMQQDEVRSFYIVGTINGVGYNGSSSNPPQTMYWNSDLGLFSDTARGAMFGGAVYSPRAFSGTVFYSLGPPPITCYANCDGSTIVPFLNVADFACFMQKFAAGDMYANCDNSNPPPILNVADFGCFLSKFAAGCSAP